jgi:hypothetical protein
VTSEDRQALEKLLHQLDAAAHDDEQITLWARFFWAHGHSTEDVTKTVIKAVKQKRGKSGAEDFAKRVRQHVMWRKPKA